MSDTYRELDAVTAQIRKLDEKRAPLLERARGLVIEKLKEGLPPTEVADHSPYSDSHVRTLARVAGLPPARRGKTRVT
jgi:hypothetical protein